MTARRQWLGMLVASAMAFGTLLPFFATYSPHAVTASSIFGDKILICTGDGFALVKWSDLESGKAPVRQDKKLACPLCYVAAHALNILVPAVAALLLYATMAGRILPFPVSCPRRLAYASCYSRAPPFSFIG